MAKEGTNRQMTIYTLYVKTHQTTGLKYLGQTTKDPIIYLGSGHYWLRHLKIHGKNLDTQILCETTDKNKIKELGIYYSELWNVVESEEWANLKPETGNGAAPGKDNHMKNPIVRAKHSKIINDPIIKEKHRTATIQGMNRPEVKEKLKEQRNTTEYKIRLKNTLHKPEIIDDRFGNKNPNFDPTIYNFSHTGGIVFTGTRYEFDQKYKLTKGSLSRLVNGKYKITQGWRIISPN
jgi:hypothetical protein